MKPRAAVLTGWAMEASGAVMQRIQLTAESGAVGTLGVNYSQTLTPTTTLTDNCS